MRQVGANVQAAMSAVEGYLSGQAPGVVRSTLEIAHATSLDVRIVSQAISNLRHRHGHHIECVGRSHWRWSPAPLRQEVRNRKGTTPVNGEYAKGQDFLATVLVATGDGDGLMVQDVNGDVWRIRRMSLEEGR